jgi:hypothetical protein
MLRIRALSIAILMGGSAAVATPVVVSDPYHFLTVSSTNTVGIVPGIRQSIGAQSVTPNGGAGTTAVAIQNATQLTLPWFGTTQFNNEFSLGIDANPSLYGAWTLVFTNGGDQATAVTPAITPAAPMPFVRNTRLAGNTVSWVLPADSRIDAVRINVRDHGPNLAGTGSDIVYNATFNRTTTSVTLPAILSNGLPLDGTHRYTVEISLIDATTNSASFTQSQILNRSRLYVDFTPTTQPVYLPVIDPGPGGNSPVYHFDIGGVVAGSRYDLELTAAAGYDFASAAGNPNFRSVVLPSGNGSGVYTVVLSDGQSFAAGAGEVFDFGIAGVSSFGVRGITSAFGPGSLETTAFIAGVTFIGAGDFTGTLTPVPEPSTRLALLCGLWLAAAARRRAARHARPA